MPPIRPARTLTPPTPGRAEYGASRADQHGARHPPAPRPFPGSIRRSRPSQTKRLASFNALYAQREEAQTEAAAQTSEAARGGMASRAWPTRLAAQGVGPGGTGGQDKLRLQTVNDRWMIDRRGAESAGQEARAPAS